MGFTCDGVKSCRRFIQHFNPGVEDHCHNKAEFSFHSAGKLEPKKFEKIYFFEEKNLRKFKKIFNEGKKITLDSCQNSQARLQQAKY